MFSVTDLSSLFIVVLFTTYPISFLSPLHTIFPRLMIGIPNITSETIRYPGKERVSTVSAFSFVWPLSLSHSSLCVSPIFRTCSWCSWTKLILHTETKKQKPTKKQNNFLSARNSVQKDEKKFKTNVQKKRKKNTKLEKMREKEKKVLLRIQNVTETCKVQIEAPAKDKQEEEDLIKLIYAQAHTICRIYI